ncbi:MAG: ATP-dependent dethiobiotin synthetase BioD, partial [Nitrosopumilus sp.]
GIIINDFDSNGYKIKELTRDFKSLTNVPVLGSIPFITNFTNNSLYRIFKKSLNFKLLLR